MYDLDVLVVGAGIGGLTSAIALQRAGHRVRVVDQVREMRAAGAGISLWSNGVKVLNELGLGTAVANMGGLIERMSYADADGVVMCDFSLIPLIERVGQRPYPVARADLQAMLLAAVGAEHISLGMRCVAVSQHDGAVAVRFDDGTTTTADLVVAADGTHSRLRADIVGREVAREYAGYVNWNGLVDDDEAIAPPGAWQLWVGDGKRVSIMPVGHGRSYVFFDVPMPVAEALAAPPDPHHELAELFRGWAALPVRRLLDAVAAVPLNRIAIHDHEPVDVMARGRVALLGDAAHSTAPDLGQGGCQAMEDALVLTRYLTTTTIGVEDALARYSAERVARTDDIMRRARTRARLTHAHDPAATAAWYEELRSETGESIIGGIARSILDGPCR